MNDIEKLKENHCKSCPAGEEKHICVDCVYYSAIQALQLMQKQEQGLLLRAIENGYVITSVYGDNVVVPFKVNYIRLNDLYYVGEEGYGDYSEDSEHEIVYETKEEAEQKLKELNGEVVNE